MFCLGHAYVSRSTDAGLWTTRTPSTARRYHDLMVAASSSIDAMLTQPAQTARYVVHDAPHAVFTRSQLLQLGCSPAQLVAALDAGRWQRWGRAIVAHNGPPTRDQAWQAALINCGPRAVLTSFTALESLGLAGWTRAEIHVLAPAGVPQPRVPGLAIRLHRCATWNRVELHPACRCHRLAAATVVAASSFGSARPACGLFAATVQQRLARPAELRAAVVAASRTRHRHALLAAVDDIAMGAQALSEIDFARLCRRHRLPQPVLQQVRVEPRGRRRYLDAEWRLPGGR